MASALVALEELPEDLVVASSEGEPSSYVLTVTVVSSPFSVETPACGDLLVLEMVRQAGPIDASGTAETQEERGEQEGEGGLDEQEKGEEKDEEGGRQGGNPEGKEEKKDESQKTETSEEVAKPVRIFMKVLRWPGVALQKDLQKEEEDTPGGFWGNNLPTWLGGTPQNKPSQRENTVGVVSACLCRRRVGEDEKKKAAALNALDTMTFLSLGIDPELQANTVAALAPKDSHTTSTGGNEEDQSDLQASTPELLLACLCSDGHIHVYSPWKLLQLSESSAKKSKVDDRDAFANGMSSFLLGDYIFQQLQSSIWPLSQPEASVKLTVPLPKPGQQSKREDKNDADNSESSSSPSDKEGEASGLSLWDRSVWDPQVDPFTAIYRTADNVPTHCISAFEYVAIAGRGRRAQARAAKSKQSAQGGFVTLLSLQHFAEIRTLFLPFVPKTVSPFAWGGMQFLFVIGDQGVAVAIRIDISVHNTVICGEAPSPAKDTQDPSEPIIPTVSSDQSLVSHQSSSSHHNPERKKTKKARCVVHRFQILPIVLPETISDETEAMSVARATLFGSSAFCSPPGIVMVSDYNAQKQVLVLQSKLEAVDYIRAASNSAIHRLFRGYRRSRIRKLLAITTSNKSRHVARIQPIELKAEQVSGSEEALIRSKQANKWCHLGQGWCLLGISSSVYFVCWEGATSSEGPFVCELQQLTKDPIDKRPVCGLHCDILPVDPFTSQEEHNSFSSLRPMGADVQLPHDQDTFFSDAFKLLRMSSAERKRAELKTATAAGSHESGVDSLVVEAIQSISIADYKENTAGSNLQSSGHYSNREKSIRLLEKCPAWFQLEDSKHSRVRMEGQAPAVNIRPQNHVGNLCMLTLRRSADSRAGTPFHQILSWLSQNEEYFIAASVALDLTSFNAATLKHLWRSFDRIDEDDERNKLEGLLDGIIPIQEQMESSHVGLESDQIVQFTMMQLADLTIGCLCRGGFAMSSTLEFFLQEDPHYDGSRACLLLAAISAQSVANEELMLVPLMGSTYTKPADEAQFVQDIIWPVRCLLQVGVARKMLPSAMALINAVVPNELRRKRHHDSMLLCAALVKLIIGSSHSATELLLEVLEEEESKRFWSSLDHKTQMELALVRIHDKCPLLQQWEVRSWALNCLEGGLHDAAFDSGRQGQVPTDWLRSLCSCCLVNSGCDIDGLMAMCPAAAELDSDGLAERTHELDCMREALISGSGSGGLDFNLFIPALLLLENCNQQWNTATLISTQSMLNAACSLAGHVTVEEPLFALDSASLMKQCAVAGNVRAGAALVGGKNGLILECCWVLIECCALSMEESEMFLRKEDVDLQPWCSKHSESEKLSEVFALGRGHKHVLWLLSKHVLQVRTYGEFDSSPARGKVEPVFAARCCLRVWYLLTKAQLPCASAWLVRWLSRQLGMGNDVVSSKRLACAALTQVLLWSRGNCNVLAEQMKLESRFLVQLSQACWGLVESVPPAIAEELLAKDDTTSLLQVRMG